MGAKKWIPYAPVAAVTLVLAVAAMRTIVERLGHPGAVLDDAYIHFQYARAIAEGHALRYEPGEPISTGATSALWPVLLAPFYLVGFRGEAILWVAWSFSFAALGLLAVEAFELTKPLAGRTAAIGAGAMVLTFGGNLWCAASGMEVVPFAFVLARAFRKAAEWSESSGSENDATKKTPSDFWELASLGWAAFLFRPEGAVAVLAIVLVLVVFPRSPEIVKRARDGAIAVALPVAVMIFLRLATGTASTSTASVKLLFGNPYYRGDVFVAVVKDNLHTFFEKLLAGQVWSAEFIPSGGLAFAIAGLFAIALCGHQAKRWWRAAFVLVLALEMLAPTTYVTFLWNRLRYLWPFATGWLVGLACLAKVAGDALGQIRPSWKIATPILVGIFAGAFATRLGGILDDLADSASGIDRQHVVLGNWAKTNVPPGARIGVNDTGAIAYFGDHPTFDIVGLTTPGEGRYWVAGPASRYEHYEHMKKETPDRLPRFFIVYPNWMACDPVLGPLVYEATVTDSTILGGQTMGVYVADYDMLGAGDDPWTTGVAPESIVDTLDVADLESEDAHHYELLGAHDGEEIVRSSLTPDGRTVADGGRTNRLHDRFVATLVAGQLTRLVARVESKRTQKILVLANDREIGWISLVGEGEWEEADLVLPGDAIAAQTKIELRAEAPYTSFHYYFGSM